MRRTWQKAWFTTLAVSSFFPWSVGATEYSVTLPCGEIHCLATAMNDSGEVAGYIQPGGPILAVYRETGMVQIDTRGIAAAMNKSGVVVGSDSANRAFAFVPRTSMLLNLNPVFGWTSGIAYSINDEGYILGSGDKLVDFGTAGLNSAVPRKINNSRQIVGTYVDPETNTQGGYLYTPGQPVVTFPGASIFDLNNAGQVLLLSFTTNSPGSKPIGTTTLYTPRESATAVFAGDLYPVAMNDDGAVVGQPSPDSRTPSSLWTRTNGVVTLQSLLPADTEYSIWSPQAINNRGQILTWVFLTSGGATSIILTPWNANDCVSGRNGLPDLDAATTP